MKRKKINRKQLIHTFIFALFCVFGLTVAYSALSTTLNISGSAQVNSSEWSFLLEEMDNATLQKNMEGDAFVGTVTDNYVHSGTSQLIKKGTISGTSINNIELGFTKPGDTLCVYYNLTNTGTIPAILTSYIISTPTITSLTNNSSDVAWGNDNFFFYSGLVKDGNIFDVDSVLCPEETAFVMICGSVSSGATTVPSSTLTVSNLNADFVFTQAELNSCPA